VPPDSEADAASVTGVPSGTLDPEAGLVIVTVGDGVEGVPPDPPLPVVMDEFLPPFPPHAGIRTDESTRSHAGQLRVFMERPFVQVRVAVQSL